MEYELYKSGSEWRWRLRAANGKVIANGEGYKNKVDALSVIDLIKASSQCEIRQITESPPDMTEESHGY